MTDEVTMKVNLIQIRKMLKVIYIAYLNCSSFLFILSGLAKCISDEDDIHLFLDEDDVPAPNESELKKDWNNYVNLENGGLSLLFINSNVISCKKGLACSTPFVIFTSR